MGHIVQFSLLWTQVVWSLVSRAFALPVRYASRRRCELGLHLCTVWAVWPIFISQIMRVVACVSNFASPVSYASRRQCELGLVSSQSRSCALVNIFLDLYWPKPQLCLGQAAEVPWLSVRPQKWHGLLAMSAFLVIQIGVLS